MTDGRRVFSAALQLFSWQLLRHSSPASCYFTLWWGTHASWVNADSQTPACSQTPQPLEVPAPFRLCQQGVLVWLYGAHRSLISSGNRAGTPGSYSLHLPTAADCTGRRESFLEVTPEARCWDAPALQPLQASPQTEGETLLSAPQELCPKRPNRAFQSSGNISDLYRHVFP